MSDDIEKKISEADLPNQKFRFEITSEFETHFRFFLEIPKTIRKSTQAAKGMILLFEN